jgi:hypothetical protein
MLLSDEPVQQLLLTPLSNKSEFLEGGADADDLEPVLPLANKPRLIQNKDGTEEEG